MIKLGLLSTCIFIGQEKAGITQPFIKVSVTVCLFCCLCACVDCSGGVGQSSLAFQAM